MNLQQHEAALEELKQLKDLVPDDANVHYMLGKVYKKLHNRADALRHYTIAMNLDPKVWTSVPSCLNCPANQSTGVAPHQGGYAGTE